MEAEGLKAFGNPRQLRKRPGCFKAFVQTTLTHYHCKLSFCSSSSTAAAAVIIFRRAHLPSSRQTPVTMSGESASASAKKDLVHPFTQATDHVRELAFTGDCPLDIGIRMKALRALRWHGHCGGKGLQRLHVHGSLQVLPDTVQANAIAGDPKVGPFRPTTPPTELGAVITDKPSAHRASNGQAAGDVRCDRHCRGTFESDRIHIRRLVPKLVAVLLPPALITIGAVLHMAAKATLLVALTKRCWASGDARSPIWQDLRQTPDDN